MLVCLLSGLWALASPLFSGPDEPAHVRRAAAISRGQLTGDDPQRDDLTDGYLEVSIPKIYGDARIACFAFYRDLPASCQSFDGSSDNGPVLTLAARHPPFYYAMAGIVSRPYPPGSGSVYLMRLVSVALTGALVASVVVALRKTAAPRLAAAGILLAITPMVLFVSGTVNPSALEIASAIALWAGGLVLVARAPDRVDPRLVALVGVAASLLALSRQLGPLWLALIVVALLVVGGKASIVALLRSRVAQIWAAVVATCTVAQVLWIAIVKPLDTSLTGTELDLSGSEVFRRTFGTSFGRYRELIGGFGWLDTPAPSATILLWTLALGALLLIAATFGPRRNALVLLVLLLAIVAVPVALEYQAFNDAGGFFWQGRYTLPLAVGVPILAAFSITRIPETPRLVRGPLLPTLGAMVVVAHVLAFAQNLRRYTVGYNGPVWYWSHEDWHPPLPSGLLTLAFGAAMLAFVTWLLIPDSEEPMHASTDRVSPTSVGVRPPHARTAPSATGSRAIR